MAVLVPILRDPDGASFFDLQVQLEGVTYTLEMRWNERMQAWFMNVLDSEGVTAFIVGARLCADWPIAQELVDRNPPGVFFLVDTAQPTGNGDEPGFGDLGNRHQLHYVPSDEL